ncbi:MAG: MBL fold metallo-hydrolase [Clostridia bacterium]|nr:MBL fold metallo-hydrolase [Clostridia bacterium]
MELQILQVPPLGTNCYFIVDSGKVGIVDPGGSGDSIIRFIEDKSWHPESVLLTHGHFDHAGAAGQLKEYFGIPICIHRLDAPMLENAKASHAERFGFPYSGCTADRLLEENDTFSVGDTVFSVLHTPGHTKGSSCFLSGDTMLSGDTLFFRSIGRFERRDKETMKKSIKRLLSMDEGVRVYPGHERDTTIGAEKKFNPFANFDWEWE